MTADIARDAVFYAPFVTGYLLLSTGLATLRYGEDFLPPKIRRFQQREGWPGHELYSHGWRRIVGIAFGLALFAVDLFGLVGLPVAAAVNADPAVIVYLLEFAVVIVWTILLWRWLRSHQRTHLVMADPRERLRSTDRLR